PLDCLTDDAVPSDENNATWNMIRGGYTPSTTIDYNWETCYKMIRRANIFLANYKRIPWADTEEPKYLEAEVRALRAFYYFDMVKGYGGVPLLGDKVFEQDDAALLSTKRNSFEECINYIIGELDDILKNGTMRPESDLTERASKNGADGADPYSGRIRKSIVQALKAKVLLYAASPLFNPDPRYPSYAHQDKPYTGYPTYDAGRWKKAADAAEEVINSGRYDLEDNRYVLNNTSINKEVIWMCTFSDGFKTTDYGYKMSPVGMLINNKKTDGVVSPTQELVDAFPMQDGRSIEKAKQDGDYNLQKPYEKRDPRLGHTVFYHGAKWLNTTLNMSEGGTNKPNKRNEYPVQTLTGYYAKKFLANDETNKEFTKTNFHPFYPSAWMIIRYADILLMYAEAINEYEDNSANREKAITTALVKIRKRAGITKGSGKYGYGIPDNPTQDELRELIRNERRIELAFEEARFYDIRRWKIAKDVYTKPLHGVIIQKQSGVDTFSESEVASPYFTDAMYLLPIALKETQVNPELEQNPEYK
uniref:RagB/SusD family nutrient uptake outer membrane protein n=2 Tax=Bacteroides TaxID=816 RepID=UPI00319D982B